MTSLAKTSTLDLQSSVPFIAIDHVQLAMSAGSEARARDFYSGLLGMKEIAKPAALAKRGGCWFESGKVQFILGSKQISVPPGKRMRRCSVPTMHLCCTACRKQALK
jgi:4-hydroxyphenylpyruvate dioxygenase-like putative hemolysin